MTIYFCSPVSNGCSSIIEDNSDDRWIHCPNCTTGFAYKVTMDNLSNIIEDDDIREQARELLAANNEV